MRRRVVSMCRVPRRAAGALGALRAPVENPRRRATGRARVAARCARAGICLRTPRKNGDSSTRASGDARRARRTLRKNSACTFSQISTRTRAHAWARGCCRRLRGCRRVAAKETGRVCKFVRGARTFEPEETFAHPSTDAPDYVRTGDGRASYFFPFLRVLVSWWLMLDEPHSTQRHKGTKGKEKTSQREAVSAVRRPVRFTRWRMLHVQNKRVIVLHTPERLRMPFERRAAVRRVLALVVLPP